jgi:PAS domain S-box-containing protein
MENNNVEVPDNTFSLNVSTFDKTIPDLYNHKSLLERSESIGRLGYWEYDVKNDNLWASSGARKIYGFDENEISLNDIKKIVFPEYRIQIDEKFKRLVKQYDKYETEFKIFRKYDGEIIHIRSQAEYDVQQKIIYGIIQDITLQKRTEEELAEALHRAKESDQLKSAFVSNMSHEIRTPMNGIVGFAHLLIEDENDYDTRNEYKEQIQFCCNQLLDKVNAILDIAKIESGQVVLTTGEVKINELINKIFETHTPQARKKDLEMKLNITNLIDRQVVLTDSTKLTTIISNLLDNAIRFTGSGFVELGYKITNEEIEFYVKDTGIGISPVHHEIIFEPFRHANCQIPLEYGGTGLGLSIAKNYVSMLGGRIWLESQLGCGSTFYFSIPGSFNSLNIAKNPAQKKKLSQNKKSLIVEDMEMNYIYLKVLLEDLGFSVLWAKDGNEAIEMALENMDIDLVLMDIRLPNTDGYEATRVIREKRPDLPIIAQTANALFDEREKALESGCNEYITKPIYKNAFKNMISKFFEI